MWPQTKKLKTRISEGKFEYPESLKAHVAKAQLGYKDQLSVSVLIKAEKRVEEREEKGEDAATGREEEEKKLPWWVFRDNSPHV